jgi:hypothetical protein
MLVVIVSALIASGNVPVYLNCTLAGPDGPELALALSEEKGTVTIANPNATWTVPANFTADSVSWGDPYVFNIDRTTLELSEKADAGDVHIRHEGSCKLSKPKKRAF